MGLAIEEERVEMARDAALEERGRRKGIADERARVVRCYDACLAGIVTDDDVRKRLDRFSRMLTTGAEPEGRA